MQKMVKMTQHITTLFDQINTFTSTINTLESWVTNNRGRGDRDGNERSRSGDGKDCLQRNSGNTVGHTAMVDTKGQTAETKPTAINKELQPKTKWEAEPEDVIHPPERGGLENKIVNQLIIPTTVSPTY